MPQPALKLPSITCKRVDFASAANVKLDKDVTVHVSSYIQKSNLYLGIRFVENSVYFLPHLS